VCTSSEVSSTAAESPAERLSCAAVTSWNTEPAPGG
jgi:hypothetical protein